jgi:hypothetical protein
MDREEFSASLSDEQKEYIAYRRDAYLELANRCIDEYKDNPSEELIQRMESILSNSVALHILLNQPPTSEQAKANKAYQDIIDNHQKNMELAKRNKKLEKTLMSRLVGKAEEFLEMTYMFLALGFGAGVGLFVLNQLCKILGV